VFDDPESWYRYLFSGPVVRYPRTVLGLIRAQRAAQEFVLAGERVSVKDLWKKHFRLVVRFWTGDRIVRDPAGHYARWVAKEKRWIPWVFSPGLRRKKKPTLRGPEAGPFSRSGGSR